MKQTQKQLKRRTVFVFRSAQKVDPTNTDPTTATITIISNGTRLDAKQ